GAPPRRARGVPEAAGGHSLSLTSADGTYPGAVTPSPGHRSRSCRFVGPLGASWSAAGGPWAGPAVPARCPAAIRSVTVHSGENGAFPHLPPVPGRNIRRRDRRGRGLRGQLVPPDVPLYRTRAQHFDDMVLDAVARLEPRWETELAGIEFAVQEVPEADELADDSSPLPLARLVPGSADPQNPTRSATPSRIIVYRRPLMARAEDDDELSDLVFDVIVEEFAQILELDPEAVDPGYRGGFDWRLGRPAE